MKPDVPRPNATFRSVGTDSLVILASVQRFGANALELTYKPVNDLFHHKVFDVTPLSAPENQFVDHSTSIGIEKRAHIEALGALPRIASAWHAQHGRPMQPADVDAMYNDFVPLLLAVLEQHSMLIPGLNQAIAALQAMDIPIAASTGYFVEATELVRQVAARQGYAPEFTISANQVPAGRPAPWMIYRAMEALGVYPPQAVVAVGDTVPDVEAALNAGVWAVGVAQTGNEVGLNEAEFAALPLAEQEAKRNKARATLSYMHSPVASLTVRVCHDLLRSPL